VMLMVRTEQPRMAANHYFSLLRQIEKKRLSKKKEGERAFVHFCVGPLPLFLTINHANNAY
jgi:hypothetical protein